VKKMDGSNICKKCQKQLNKTDRMYSMIYKGYVCLECYHDQFPKLPLHPTPILIKGNQTHDTLTI